jgi:ribonuclease-3
MINLSLLEDTLGVSFRNKDLLKLALVHSSFLNENPGVFLESNERLEYLGDAVLGLIIAEELFVRHPDWGEGDLTQVRADVVQRDTLARVSEALSLGEYLYIGKGEENGGGRCRQSNLANVFEAVIGAILLDQGYAVVRASCLRILSGEIDSAGQRTGSDNPKSALQELVQLKGRGVPVYSIVDTVGEDHLRTFTAEVRVAGEVFGRGVGRRKSDAEQSAARDALVARFAELQNG